MEDETLDDAVEPTAFWPEKDEAGELEANLEREKARADELEEKLKHTMADFQNLERKTQSDIQRGIRAGVDRFVLDVLSIYDDLARAREAAGNDRTLAAGFEAMIGNMQALLEKHGVSEMDLKGQFDPRLHEAVSIVEDAEREDETIIRVIRKGYISHGMAIRPALVEISKRPSSGRTVK